MTPAVMRRTWWAGGAAAALYVVVALATGGRPLFDGFAPPAPYRWVNPPPEFAAGNQPPESAERTVPLTDEGNEATNASTTDAQIIVTLPAGAIAAHPPDAAVLLRLVPLDPARLGVLPSDLRPQSNAYQVVMTYQPSGAPVTDFKSGPAIAMTAGAHGTQLLFSRDGQSWEETASRPFGATQGLTGPLRGAGHYVVAAPPQVTSTTSAPGGSGGAAGIAAGAVALGAVVVAGLTLRSRRKQQRRRAAVKAKAVAQAKARAKGKAGGKPGAGGGKPGAGGKPGDKAGGGAGGAKPGGGGQAGGGGGKTRPATPRKKRRR